MTEIYHLFFYNPLYNILITLFKVFPWADAGIVVILLTLVVRIILFPLSRKAIRTQVHMQQIAPKLEEIKSKFKDNQQEQARATMALYKEKGINPFSGIFVLLIQLPIIWALYRIFLYSGLPAVNASMLYSFITAPTHINVEFLGLINITHQSVFLAVFAAITSYFQIKLSTGAQTQPKGNSFSDNLSRNMQKQMKYFFPILVFFISYKISGVIALYWCTTNLFTIVQEVFVRRKIQREAIAA